MERKYSDCGSGRIGQIGRIRNLSSKNQRERSSDSQKGYEIIFPVAHGTEKLPVRDHSEAGNKPLGAKISVEIFKVNGERLDRPNQQKTLEPVPTIGRFNVTSSIVITMNLEFKLYVPKEETFPIPLEYIDVARSI